MFISFFRSNAVFHLAAVSQNSDKIIYIFKEKLLFSIRALIYKTSNKIKLLKSQTTTFRE